MFAQLLLLQAASPVLFCLDSKGPHGGESHAGGGSHARAMALLCAFDLSGLIIVFLETRDSCTDFFWVHVVVLAWGSSLQERLPVPFDIFYDDVDFQQLATDEEQCFLRLPALSNMLSFPLSFFPMPARSFRLGTLPHRHAHSRLRRALLGFRCVGNP